MIPNTYHLSVKIEPGAQPTGMDQTSSGIRETIGFKAGGKDYSITFTINAGKLTDEQKATLMETVKKTVLTAEEHIGTKQGVNQETVIVTLRASLSFKDLPPEIKEKVNQFLNVGSNRPATLYSQQELKHNDQLFSDELNKQLDLLEAASKRPIVIPQDHTQDNMPQPEQDTAPPVPPRPSSSNMPQPEQNTAPPIPSRPPLATSYAASSNSNQPSPLVFEKQSAVQQSSNSQHSKSFFSRFFKTTSIADHVEKIPVLQSLNRLESLDPQHSIRTDSKGELVFIQGNNKSSKDTEKVLNMIITYFSQDLSRVTPRKIGKLTNNTWFMGAIKKHPQLEVMFQEHVKIAEAKEYGMAQDRVNNLLYQISQGVIEQPEANKKRDEILSSIKQLESKGINCNELKNDLETLDSRFAEGIIAQKQAQEDTHAFITGRLNSALAVATGLPVLERIAGIQRIGERSFESIAEELLSEISKIDLQSEDASKKMQSLNTRADAWISEALKRYMMEDLKEALLSKVDSSKIDEFEACFKDLKNNFLGDSKSFFEGKQLGDYRNEVDILLSKMVPLLPQVIE